MGHQVHILEDCTSSRTSANRSIGLEKMKRSGETSLLQRDGGLFELMRKAIWGFFVFIFWFSYVLLR